MAARQTKTPRQRAEEALAVAERRVVKLTEARDLHKGRLQFAEQDLIEAEERRDYLRSDPALDVELP